MAAGGEGGLSFAGGKLRRRRTENDPRSQLPARDLTKWFGWAFSMDRRARLVGQANAGGEEELLAHFRSIATGPWRIHYWPPGPSPQRRVVRIEPQ
jgi:hypothetical protein